MNETEDSNHSETVNETTYQGNASENLDDGSDSNESADNGSQSSSQIESKDDDSNRTLQLFIAFALMFTGTWFLFFLLGQQISSDKSQDEKVKKDITFIESGIQDSTAQFVEVSSMIELPPLPTPDVPEVARNEGSISPPVPDEGLPEGWTMEQWEYYGQQWLDTQN